MPIVRNSLLVKGRSTTRLISAYMRVEPLTYRKPTIPGAAINDFRATKGPVLGDLRPLQIPIPFDFVVDAGACILHEMGHPRGSPHLEK